MLEKLTIDNFTIIDHFEVNFKKGLSSLTGETGAGKSIIIDAIGQIAGAKSSKEIVRKGTAKAEILAEFVDFSQDLVNSLLADNDIEATDDYLVIQKEIRENGRSLARVNGSVVNNAFLRELSSLLLNIEEQNRHQDLLQKSFQARLLDEFAGSKVHDLLVEYQDIFNNLQKTKLLKDQAQKKYSDLKERFDYLSYAVNEIEEAAPKVDEDKTLIEKKSVLSNSTKIQNDLLKIIELLSSENSVQDLLGQAVYLSEELTKFGDTYQKINTSLQDASYLIDTALGDTVDLSDESNGNSDEDLDSVMNRLELLNSLQKKYGGDLSEVLSYAEHAKSEISSYNNSQTELDDLNNKIEELSNKAQEKANELTKERQLAADRLKPLVENELASLEMPNFKFEIVIDKVELKNYGQDDIEFMIQTNIGEPFGPLRKVSSGGEMSRILLALKAIFAKFFTGVTFIFDEIDSGVSGKVAQKMADKIYQIAKNNQVIVITHLPQLAAMSDYQFLIAKDIKNERTVSSIRLLNEEQRAQEIAQMLTGTKMTELTLTHAREMIQLANKAKESE